MLEKIEREKMTKVLFLHGLDLKSDNIKRDYLKKRGFEVIYPQLPKSSFEESIKIAQNLIDKESPNIVAASDRGCAVSLCLELNQSKLVLVAPTWLRFNQSKNKMFPKHSMIIFSKNDDEVSFSDISSNIKKSLVNWIIVGKNHKMVDADALEALVDAVKWSSGRK